MAWSFTSRAPVYMQIVSRIRADILGGVYQPDQQIPAVRQLALTAGVNPNTVQRSFETLEQQHILYSVRGSGWYVAEDISPAMQTLKNLWAEKTAAYFAAMEALGMTPQAIKDYVEEWNI